MKKFLAAAVLLLLFQETSAQYNKYIIKFTNKQGNSFSVSNPSQFLSTKAIQRRSQFNISIDSTDLPVTAAYIQAVKNQGAVTVLSTSKWLNQILIQTTDANALSKIEALPFVVKAQAIGLKPAITQQFEKFKEDSFPLPVLQSKTTADYYNYGASYNQVHIHEGEFLHNKGYRGQGITIAVLDAGFHQYKAISLFDSIRNNGQILGERDFVNFDNSTNEDDSHGRQCLGVLAANSPAQMVGTAPAANYWLVRTENAASEFPIEEHNWVVGAEFADSAGAAMISSSLGYNWFDDAAFNHSYNEFYKNSAMVTQGASLAVKKGMIVMNSAGNEGTNGWKYLIFPADADSVCAVGAVNAQGQIAGFSSYGYPGKTKPNIVSVGWGAIVAGLNGPASSNGTSFSNPNIAGLIACLWQAFPSFSNMQILDAVYRSSDRYNNPDDRYGFGIPNMRKAYHSLKAKQNISLYGNEWLFATPDPFIDTIGVKLIGRVDGDVKVELFNPQNVLVATKNLTTEKEELYRFSFENLNNLPEGNYTVKYTDYSNSRSVIVRKNAVANSNTISIVANKPNANIVLSYKANETGKVSFRMIDTKGNLIETIEQNVADGNVYTLNFRNSMRLPRAVYFIQFEGKTNYTLRFFRN